MEEYKKITEEPVRGLKGLEGLSFQSNTGSSDDRFEEIQRKTIEILSKPQFNNKDYFRQSLSGYGKDYEYSTGQDVGSSIYDKEIYSPGEAENIGDIRAEEQSAIAKLGAGIGKGVSLAGTTFLDGTIGLIYGGLRATHSAIFDEDATGWESFSKIWDNEISNGLKAWNDKMEEWVPNYRSSEEKNRAWYQNLGTMNFWADSFLKNMGFVVGAYYSGGAWNKLFKSAGILHSSIGAQITGSTLSAVNEGRIEANHTMHNVRDLESIQLEDAFNKIMMEIDASDKSEAEKALDRAVATQRHNLAQQDLEDRMHKMGATVLLANTVLLTLDNLNTFGKLYAQGYKTAAKNAADRVKKEGSRRVFDPLTWKSAVKSGAMTALVEGQEEMSQQFISDFAGNWQTYDSPDSYYIALTNPNAELKTRDFLSSTINAWENSYGNMDQYEQFAVGALTGLLGVPTFGKSNNSGDITYLGKGKSIGLSGGIFGELAENKVINTRTQEIVDHINNFEDNLQSRFRHYTQSQSFTDIMDGWAEEQNAFEYKNAEDNDTFSVFSRYASIGRLDDLKYLISQDFENLNDETLETIASTTTDHSLGNFGGWKNADGSLMSSTEDGRAIMRFKLAEKRDAILSQLDNYEKSLEKVRELTRGNLSEDQTNELAWLLWKTERFNDRYKSIRQEHLDYFRILSNSLLNARDNLERSVLNNEKALQERRQTLEYKAIDSIINALSQFMGSESIIDLSAKLANSEFTLDVIEEESFYKEFGKNIGLNYSTYKDTITGLRDMSKLYFAYKSFDTKLKEYLQNPNKLQENRDSIEEQQAEIVRQNEIATKEKTIKEANVPQVVQMLGTESLTEEDIDAITDPEIKTKVEEALKIKDIRDTALSPDVLGSLTEDDVDGQTLEDVKKLIEKGVEGSLSAEELLNLEALSYQDPRVLLSEEESLEMIDEASKLEELSARLDSARSLLSKVYEFTIKHIEEKEELPDSTIVRNDTREEPGIDSPGYIEPSNSEKPISDENLGSREDAQTPEITIPEGKESQYTGEARNRLNRTDSGQYVEWIPSISEFLFSNINRRTIEEYASSDVVETYNYLLKKGAFKFVDLGKLKVGDTISFTSDPELNSKVGEMVILLSKGDQVIGVLPRKANSSGYINMESFYSEFEKQYNSRPEEEKTSVFVFPKTTKVNKLLLGKPQYSEQRIRLNDIFRVKNSDGSFSIPKFELGVVVSINSDGTNAKILTDSRIKRTAIVPTKIISPKTSKLGQPYVILSSADENRKIAVPFSMPKFSLNHSETKLYKDIKEILERLNKKSIDSIKFKDSLLRRLAFTKVWLDEGDTSYQFTIDSDATIKKYTLSLEYGDNKLKLDIVPGNVNVDSILSTIASWEVPYQISIQDINKEDFNIKVGELAETNLTPGIMTSVNNWFTIQPVSIESEEETTTTNSDEGTKTPSNIEDNDEGITRILNKDIWDTLSNEIKSKIRSLDKNTRNSILKVLKQTKGNTSRLSSLHKKVLGLEAKHRLVSTKISKDKVTQKELQWLKSIYPEFSTEERLKIVEGLIKVSGAPNWAYGMFKDGIITLSDLAARGTVYHEAFHAVTATLLSRKEIDRMFEAAKERWGNLSEDELEEKLAESFREYMQYNEDKYKNKSKLQKFLYKTYEVIKNIISKLLKKDIYLDNLFYRIKNHNLGTLSRDLNAFKTTKYRFIGEIGAVNWDLAQQITIRMDNLSVAEKMETNNVDPRTIKMATGWERGADGQWRYETIEYITEEVMDKLEQNIQDGNSIELTLAQFFGEQHPLLLAYPTFKDGILKLKQNLGIYEGTTTLGEVNGKIVPIIEIKNTHLTEAVKTLVHEIQHVIQLKEGFAEGSSIDFSPNYYDDVVHKSKSLLGLIQAAFHVTNGKMILNSVELQETLNILQFNPEFKEIEDLLNWIFSQNILTEENFIAKWNNWIRELSQKSQDLRAFEYERAAGEVEASNVEYRLFMSYPERLNSLAIDTERISREDQKIVHDYLDFYGPMLKIPFIDDIESFSTPNIDIRYRRVEDIDFLKEELGRIKSYYSNKIKNLPKLNMIWRTIGKTKYRLLNTVQHLSYNEAVNSIPQEVKDRFNVVENRGRYLVYYKYPNDPSIEELILKDSMKKEIAEIQKEIEFIDSNREQILDEQMILEQESRNIRIRDYHQKSLDYVNLTDDQKQFLERVKISKLEYDNMSLLEKEVLFFCML